MTADRIKNSIRDSLAAARRLQILRILAEAQVVIDRDVLALQMAAAGHPASETDADIEFLVEAGAVVRAGDAGGVAPLGISELGEDVLNRRRILAGVATPRMRTG